MKRHGRFLLAIVAISLILGSISVKAQVYDKLNENTWVNQYKLEINLESNKTFSSDGEDQAKMYIVLRNRTSNRLEYAKSDIEVVLRLGSTIGNLTSQEVYTAES
jgi:hypothetical protein